MSNYELIGIFDDGRYHVSHERMDWDSYFMSVAHLVAQRSHDSQTIHGAVFVRDNRIITTGFNGFPAGAPDNIIPNVRDFKYPFINHAEESALINAARIGASVEGCKAYITGLPCSNCSRRLVSAGILTWIVGDVGYQADEKEKVLRDFWVETFKVNVIRFAQK